MTLSLQATKLPTAVLSTTKKAQARARRRGGPQRTASGLGSKAASAALGDGAGTSKDAAMADAGESGGGEKDKRGAKEEGTKEGAKEGRKEESEEEAKKRKEEEEADAAQCPFEKANPARCAPA